MFGGTGFTGFTGGENTAENLNKYDQDMEENIHILFRSLGFEPELQQSCFYLHDVNEQPQIDENKVMNDHYGAGPGDSATTAFPGASLKFEWEYMHEEHLGPKITVKGEEEEREYTLFNEERNSFGPHMLGVIQRTCNFDLPVEPVKPIPIPIRDTDTYSGGNCMLPVPRLLPVGSERGSSKAASPTDGRRQSEGGSGMTSTLTGMCDFVNRYNLGGAQPRLGLQTQMRSHKYVNDFGRGGVYLQRRSNGGGPAPQRRLF